LRCRQAFRPRVQPTDAVNKGYVDSVVTTGGRGSFLSKLEDAMSGPLQLPGEKSEVRRGVYDGIVNAVITIAISPVIAMHDRWSK
jgi:hypothetical protein